MSLKNETTILDFLGLERQERKTREDPGLMKEENTNYCLKTVQELTEDQYAYKKK